MTELRIVPRLLGQVVIVEVVGSLNVAGAARLEDTLVPLATSGRRTVICDLSRLTNPSRPHLLTVFAVVQHLSGPWPTSAIHLAAPAPDVAEQLDRTRLPHFVPVHATIDRALAQAGLDADITAVERLEIPAPPHASAGRAARQFLARLWPSTSTERELRHDGELVVGELTANAVRHTAGACTITLAISPRRVLIAVTDTSRRLPVIQPADPTSYGGRGLHLVAALADDWGVRLIHGHGKTVWATFDRLRPTAH